MKRTGFIGRSQEYRTLERAYESNDAQLIVVYGRRRVGKTYLIDKAFEGDMAFKITGSYKKNAAFQLANFADQYSLRTGTDIEVPAGWRKAFNLLIRYIESLDPEKKQVIFIDEFPWLDTKKSGFLSCFEHFWNDYGCAKSNLMVIVAGSSSSYLTEKFMKSKGGLFNRQTARIYLEPFTLGETKEFICEKGFLLSDYEIAELYMVMGGIPFYLNHLDSALSLNENIDNIFFKRRGLLWDEYERLFKTLFGDDGRCEKLVGLLASSRYGLTRKVIAELMGTSNNGHLASLLRALMDSGFVREELANGEKKERVYYLCDFFTFFHNKFVKQNQGKNESFWSNSVDNPARRTYLGLSFELLCKLHISQIKSALGINGLNSDVYAFRKMATEDSKGAQIDLVIDRRDNVATLLEMKFSSNEFLIDKQYSFDLANKIEQYRLAFPRKSIQLVFVSTYGLAKGQYSHLVTKSLTVADLF